MNQNLAAVLLLMTNGGGFAPRRSITNQNRMHTERARPGSPEAQERINAAAAKRARKLAKRVQS